MNNQADFLAYPEFSRSLTADFRDLLPASASTSRVEHKVRSGTAKLRVLPKILFNRLSYTHLELELSCHVQ